MKRNAPAAERNRGPILEVLRRVLPPRGLVLELASGTGQHVELFARELPDLLFQPSDVSDDALASIAAYQRDAGLPNLRPPVRVDARDDDWGVAHADAILSVNMIHIAPWSACEGLVRSAARLLPAGGPLVLYGPFKVGGAHTAESNAVFDASLRARDPAWGVRDLEAVCALAASHGLAQDEVVQMPVNNLVVVLRARG